MVKCFSVLFLSDDNEMIFKYIGDFFLFYSRFSLHWNILIVMFSFWAIISLILHNYNSYSYEWLKPFEMMSGMISPKSIGIENERDIYKLMKRTRF